MPPDQHRDAAIEAARKVVNAFYKTVAQSEHEDAQAVADRVFVAAYEKAMWIEGEPPKDGQPYLVKAVGAMHTCRWDSIDAEFCVLPRTLTKRMWVPGKITHFRPLPQPPTQEGK